MYLIGSSLSGLFRVNWNLEMLVFEERGKPEYQEKNLSEQGREPTKQTQSTVDAESGNRTRGTLVGGLHGGKWSTTVPSLLHQILHGRNFLHAIGKLCFQMVEDHGRNNYCPLPQFK